ncbi:MAG: hypothetical protein WCJ56_07260 [bacterium]
MYCSLCGTNMGDTGECPQCRAASQVIPPEPVVTENAVDAPELPPSTSGLAIASLKIRLIVGIVLIFVIAAAIVGYEYHSVPVTAGTIVQCSDSRHQGDKVLSNDVKNLSVHFFDKEKYKVRTSFIVCDACRIRNEKEQEQANILRLQKEEAAKILKQKNDLEAKNRMEAANIFNSLEIKNNNKELSLAPGDRIDELSVEIKNKGNSMLDLVDARFILDSAQYVEAGPSDERTPYRQQMYEKMIKQFATEGLPIMRWHDKGTSNQISFTTLAPYNDPHYENDTKIIGANTSFVQYEKRDVEKVLQQQKDAGITNWFGAYFTNIEPSLPLIISHKALAGSDIIIGTSILIKGQKFHVSSLTVHVKHKDL